MIFIHIIYIIKKFSINIYNNVKYQGNNKSLRKMHYEKNALYLIFAIKTAREIFGLFYRKET